MSDQAEPRDQEPTARPEPALRIDIVSAVPQTFPSVLESSILGRARTSGRVEIVVHNLHYDGIGRYRQVDDAPFGGGAGMILRPEPIFDCIERLQGERSYDEVIYLTPDGERLAQSLCNRLSMVRAMILLCGHYRGIDERVRERLITREISIGDYVLTGGELPALVLCDAVVRLLPGVLGDSESALGDSFQDGLLDAPWYTRPAEYRGMTVPAVLTGGNHAEIGRWRTEQALERTRARRPDLLDEAENE